MPKEITDQELETMIKFNKLAGLCYKIALQRKKLTEHSSVKGAALGISAEWRELDNATDAPSEHVPDWSEREEEAADVIIATMSYLKHIQCRDIEKLIRDKIIFNMKRRD